MATKVRTIDFLPEIFQTPTNRQFLGATLDVLTQERNVTAVQGYIGRRYGYGISTTDRYLIEQDRVRNNYQLEPAIAFQEKDTSTTRDVIGYTGIIDKLSVLGSSTENHERLFGQQSYSWQSYINYDKLVNYQQYYWLPLGPEAVLCSTNPVYRTGTYSVTAADNGFKIENENQLNPIITLLRGGVYKFLPNQLSPFWIQGVPGITGTLPKYDNIDTREIYGVEYNGSDDRMITFTVPARDAQKEDDVEGTLVADIVTTLPYDQVHLRPVYELGEIDGVRDLAGKTLLFYGDKSLNYQQYFYKIQLVVENDLTSQAVVISNPDNSNAFWSTDWTAWTALGYSFDPTMQLVLASVDDVHAGMTVTGVGTNTGTKIQNIESITFGNTVANIVTLNQSHSVVANTVLNFTTDRSPNPAIEDLSYTSGSAQLFDQQYIDSAQNKLISVETGYDQSRIIKLVRIDAIPNREKITAQLGKTYRGRGFYRTLKGVIKLIPYLSAKLDRLYFQNPLDENSVGVIELIENNLVDSIKIDDIIGSTHYTSPNGVTFTSGLRIKFDGNVIPESYKNDSYYVEGVGSSIRLVKESDTRTPEPYTELMYLPWSHRYDWDNEPWDSKLDIPIDPNYVTQARGSRDLNAWSRGNRWFHQSVVEATYNYNKTVRSLEDLKSRQSIAQRPIIEFVPDIKLANTGTRSAGFTDFIDFKCRDALSRVNGMIEQTLYVYRIEQPNRSVPPRVTLNLTDTDLIDDLTVGQQVKISITNLYYDNYLGLDEFDAEPFYLANPQTTTYNIPVKTTTTDSIVFDTDASISAIFTGMTARWTDGAGKQQTATIIDFDSVAGTITLDRQASLTKDQVVTLRGVQFDLVGDVSLTGQSLSHTNLPTTLPTTGGTLVLEDSAATVVASAQLGYLWIDGSQVHENAVVVFAHDSDTKTRKQPYYLKRENLDNVRYTRSLVPVEVQVLDDTNIVVLRGDLSYANKGRTYRWSENQWVLAQLKDRRFQSPLFDVFDYRAISYTDSAYYPDTTFTGSTIFQYAVGTSTQVDQVLGIPLKYSSINNIADVTFAVTLHTDSFTYDNGQKTISTSDGYVHVSGTRTIGWTPQIEPLVQYQVIGFTIAARHLTGSLATVRVDVPALPDSGFNPVKVYKNNRFLTIDEFSYRNDGTACEIQIPSSSLNDSIVVEIHSNQTSSQGYYKIPDNLENNPYNTNMKTVDLGAIRNHWQSICENSGLVTGTFFGDNNSRDLPNLDAYGSKIIKHSGSLAMVGLLLRQNNFNLLDAIDFNRNQYMLYKQMIVDTVANMPFTSDDTPSSILDTAIDRIIQLQQDSLSFKSSDMLPIGVPYITNRYTIRNKLERSVFGLSRQYDFTRANYTGLLIYVERLVEGNIQQTQLIRNQDYTLDSETSVVHVTWPLELGDQVVVNEYTNTAGSYCPSTPSKLGLHPLFKPAVVRDETYMNPSEFIVGHDGSYTKLYGKYENGRLLDTRDQALFEFELRVFNNHKIPDTIPVTESHVVPGISRTTGYDYSVVQDIRNKFFLAWAGKNRTDYKTNRYRERNSLSYNYSSSTIKIDDSIAVGGNWRAIYKYVYGTDRPHTAPWEIIGLTIKPTWWDQTYGPAPYTNNNLPLWTDLSEGRAGLNTNKITTEHRRPWLTQYIPTNDQGALLDPFSLLIKDFNRLSFSRDWQAGDHGPTETSYYRSSDYAYDLQKLLFLFDPVRYANYNIDRDRYKYNQEFKQWLVDNRHHLDIRTTEISGTQIDSINQTVRNIAKHSYINWLIDYRSQYGVDSRQEFIDIITNMDVKLIHRIAGFTGKNLIDYYVDRASVDSTSSSLKIPDDSYSVLLYDNPVHRTLVWKSIIVQKVERGYRITGNNLTENYFEIAQAVENGQYDTISIKTDRIAVRRTYDASRTVIVPYGTVFYTLSGICEFMLAYGKKLEQLGMVFKTVYDGVEYNWLQLCGEFIRWHQQSWKQGSTIALNPNSLRLTITNDQGIVQTLANNNRSFVLDQDGKPINIKDAAIIRDGTTFEIISKNSGKTISFGRFEVATIEHVVVFDNRTTFNDIIYEPTVGLRQDRLRIRGFKTAAWAGFIDANGFILNQGNISEWSGKNKYTRGSIVKYKDSYWVATEIIEPSSEFDQELWVRSDYDSIKTGLLPNPATQAAEAINFYDLNRVNLDNDSELLAFSLVGFRQRPYMTNAGLADINQVNTYVNMLESKGTPAQLDAFRGARLNQNSIDYNIYENWAIKSAEFGAVAGTQWLEMALDAAVISGNPGILGFGKVAAWSSDSAYPENSLVRSSDNRYWISQIAVPAGIDPETANSQVWTETTYQLRSIDQPIDIDNPEHVINFGVRPTTANILPVFRDDYLIERGVPTAGYVNDNDIDYKIYNYLNLNSDSTVINNIVHDDYLWTANYKQQWDVSNPVSVGATVVRVQNNLNGTVTIAFSAAPGLSVGDRFSIHEFDTDVDGFMIVSKVVSVTEIIARLRVAKPSYTGTGVAFKYQSHRYAQPSDLINHPVSTTESRAQRLWIDRAGYYSGTDISSWQVLERKSTYRQLKFTGMTSRSQVTGPVAFSATLGTAIAYQDQRVRIHDDRGTVLTQITVTDPVIAMEIRALSLYVLCESSLHLYNLTDLTSPTHTKLADFSVSGTPVACSSLALSALGTYIYVGSIQGHCVFWLKSHVLQNSVIDYSMNDTDEYGASLALSTIQRNGERLIIGAPARMVNGVQSAGSVYVVDRYDDASGEGFSMIQRIDNPNPTIGGRFGQSVATNFYGSEFFVGAPYNLDYSNNDTVEGAVYRYVNSAQHWGSVELQPVFPIVGAGEEIDFYIDSSKITIDDTVNTITKLADRINEQLTPRDRTAIAVEATVNRLAIKIRDYSLVDSQAQGHYNWIDITDRNNAGSLTALMYQAYTLVQTIQDPYKSESSSWGHQIAMDPVGDLLVISAPRAARWDETLFDYSDNFNNDDCQFDRGSTRFIDSWTDYGRAMLYQRLPAANESADNPSQWVFADTVTDNEIRPEYLARRQRYGNGKIVVREGRVIISSSEWGNTGGDSQTKTVTGRVSIFDSQRHLPITVVRSGRTQVDVNRLSTIAIYNTDNNTVVDSIDYVDAVQGKYLGPVEENIDFISTSDPAGYGIRDIAWSDHHVGRIWFDPTDLRFYNSHQSGYRSPITSDHLYNATMWNKPFKGTRAKVYTWIESSDLPVNYTGPGVVYDITRYVTIIKHDYSTNSRVTRYYFWVENSDIINREIGKTLSAQTISEYITYPQLSGLPFVAPISSNSIALFNCDEIIKGIAKPALYLGYKTANSTDDSAHVEYNLIRDGNEYDFLNGVPSITNLGSGQPEGLYLRLLDSLSGRTQNGQSVPDTKLPRLVQHGVGRGQSMFTDRLGAVKNMIDRVNSVLRTYPVSESKTMSYLTVSGTTNGTDWKVSDWWNYANYWVEGWDDTTVAKVEVESVSQLVTLAKKQGLVARVSVGSAADSEFYVYDNNQWTRIGIERGTIQFSDRLATETNLDLVSDSIRWISRAIFEQMFVGDIGRERNNVLILLLNFAAANAYQNKNMLPWLTKTSLIDVVYRVRELAAYEKYQQDNTEFLEGYINEIKPYHAVFKEFAFKYDGQDTYSGSITDFDVPSYYDESTYKFTSPRLVYEESYVAGEYLSENQFWQQSNYQDWRNNFGLSASGVEQEQYAITNLRDFVGLDQLTIRVVNAHGLPKTGAIKIDQEWILYDDVDYYTGIISSLSRAQRDTNIGEHLPGAAVIVDMLAVEVIDSGRAYSTVPKISVEYDNPYTIQQSSAVDPTELSISSEQGTYPSVTSISLNQGVMSITTDGDPYPAQAGLTLENDGQTSRQYRDGRTILDQSYDFSFIYRGGRNYREPEPVGADTAIGITISGAVIESSASNKQTEYQINYPISSNFSYNRAWWVDEYVVDLTGGIAEHDGTFRYIHGGFLAHGWNNSVFKNGSAYISQSDFGGDNFRHPDGHSKIIGYAFDGYPIYGPYGYTVPEQSNSGTRQQLSGYRLRTQEVTNRPYSYQHLPAGALYQDYEYLVNQGTLDESNGRYCVTPDYPEGTYAYFLTYQSGTTVPAFPYIIGPTTKAKKTAGYHFNTYINNEIENQFKPTTDMEFRAILSVDRVFQVRVLNSGAGYPSLPRLTLEPAFTEQFSATQIMGTSSSASNRFVIPATGTKLITGDCVRYRTGSTSRAPHGLESGAYYYVRVDDATNSILLFTNKSSAQSASGGVNSKLNQVMMLGGAQGTEHYLDQTARVRLATTSRPVRQLDTVIKLDSTSYKSQIMPWTANNIYRGPYVDVLTLSGSSSLASGYNQDQISATTIDLDSMIANITTVGESLGSFTIDSIGAFTANQEISVTAQGAWGTKRFSNNAPVTVAQASFSDQVIIVDDEWGTMKRELGIGTLISFDAGTQTYQIRDSEWNGKTDSTSRTTLTLSGLLITPVIITDTVYIERGDSDPVRFHALITQVAADSQAKTMTIDYRVADLANVTGTGSYSSWRVNHYIKASSTGARIGVSDSTVSQTITDINTLTNTVRVTGGSAVMVGSRVTGGSISTDVWVTSRLSQDANVLYLTSTDNIAINDVLTFSTIGQVDNRVVMNLNFDDSFIKLGQLDGTRIQLYRSIESDSVITTTSDRFMSTELSVDQIAGCYVDQRVSGASILPDTRIIEVRPDPQGGGGVIILNKFQPEILTGTSITIHAGWFNPRSVWVTAVNSSPFSVVELSGITYSDFVLAYGTDPDQIVITIPSPLNVVPSMVSYQGNIYQARASSQGVSITPNQDYANWQIVPISDNRINAQDRIAVRYNPTSTMPGRDLRQLVSGIEYSGGTYHGGDLQDTPDIEYYYDVKLSGLSFNSIHDAPYEIQGGEFADGYAPPELVAGVVTDDLRMTIKTRPGSAWNYDDDTSVHVYRVGTITIDTSTVTGSGALPPRGSAYGTKIVIENPPELPKELSRTQIPATALPVVNGRGARLGDIRVGKPLAVNQGRLYKIAVLESGSDYQTAPSVVIDSPRYPNGEIITSGTRARVSTRVTNGSVTQASITYSGTEYGYTSTSTIYLYQATITQDTTSGTVLWVSATPEVWAAIQTGWVISSDEWASTETREIVAFDSAAGTITIDSHIPGVLNDVLTFNPRGTTVKIDAVNNPATWWANNIVTGMFVYTASISLDSDQLYIVATDSAAGTVTVSDTVTFYGGETVSFEVPPPRATVADGEISGIVVTNGGYGYSKLTVPAVDIVRTSIDVLPTGQPINYVVRDTVITPTSANYTLAFDPGADLGNVRAGMRVISSDMGITEADNLLVTDVSANLVLVNQKIQWLGATDAGGSSVEFWGVDANARATLSPVTLSATGFNVYKHSAKPDANGNIVFANLVQNPVELILFSTDMVISGTGVQMPVYKPAPAPVSTAGSTATYTGNLELAFPIGSILAFSPNSDNNQPSYQDTQFLVSDSSYDAGTDTTLVTVDKVISSSTAIWKLESYDSMRVPPYYYSVDWANSVITFNAAGMNYFSTSDIDVYIHEVGGGLQLDRNNTHNNRVRSSVPVAEFLNVYPGTTTVVRTTKPHQFVDGQKIKIQNVVGLSSINNNLYYVKTLADADKFEVYTDAALTIPLDSTSLISYNVTNDIVRGGTATAWDSLTEILIDCQYSEVFSSRRDARLSSSATQGAQAFVHQVYTEPLVYKYTAATQEWRQLRYYPTVGSSTTTTLITTGSGTIIRVLDGRNIEIGHVFVMDNLDSEPTVQSITFLNLGTNYTADITLSEPVDFNYGTAVSFVNYNALAETEYAIRRRSGAISGSSTDKLKIVLFTPVEQEDYLVYTVFGRHSDNYDNETGTTNFGYSVPETQFTTLSVTGVTGAVISSIDVANNTITIADTSSVFEGMAVKAGLTPNPVVVSVLDQQTVQLDQVSQLTTGTYDIGYTQTITAIVPLTNYIGDRVATGDTNYDNGIIELDGKRLLNNLVRTSVSTGDTRFTSAVPSGLSSRLTDFRYVSAADTAYGKNFMIGVGYNGTVVVNNDDITDIDQWFSQFSVTQQHLHSVAIGTNYIVAVGNLGTIIYRDLTTANFSTLRDGWGISDSGTLENLHSVTWNEDNLEFVAVGDRETILRAANPTAAWTQIAAVPLPDDLVAPETDPDFWAYNYRSINYSAQNGGYLLLGDNNNLPGVSAPQSTDQDAQGTGFTTYSNQRVSSRTVIYVDPSDPTRIQLNDSTDVSVNMLVTGPAVAQGTLYRVAQVDGTITDFITVVSMSGVGVNIQVGDSLTFDSLAIVNSPELVTAANKYITVFDSTGIIIGSRVHNLDATDTLNNTGIRVVSIDTSTPYAHRVYVTSNATTDWQFSIENRLSFETAINGLVAVSTDLVTWNTVKTATTGLQTLGSLRSSAVDPVTGSVMIVGQKNNLTGQGRGNPLAIAMAIDYTTGLLTAQAQPTGLDSLFTTNPSAMLTVDFVQNYKTGGQAMIMAGEYDSVAPYTSSVVALIGSGTSYSASRETVPFTGTIMKVTALSQVNLIDENGTSFTADNKMFFAGIRGTVQLVNTDQAGIITSDQYYGYDPTITDWGYLLVTVNRAPVPYGTGYTITYDPITEAPIVNFVNPPPIGSIIDVTWLDSTNKIDPYDIRYSKNLTSARISFNLPVIAGSDLAVTTFNRTLQQSLQTLKVTGVTINAIESIILDPATNRATIRTVYDNYLTVGSQVRINKTGLEIWDGSKTVYTNTNRENSDYHQSIQQTETQGTVYEVIAENSVREFVIQASANHVSVLGAGYAQLDNLFLINQPDFPIFNKDRMWITHNGYRVNQDNYMLINNQILLFREVAYDDEIGILSMVSTPSPSAQTMVKGLRKFGTDWALPYFARQPENTRTIVTQSVPTDPTTDRIFVEDASRLISIREYTAVTDLQGSVLITDDRLNSNEILKVLIDQGTVKGYRAETVKSIRVLTDLGAGKTITVSVYAGNHVIVNGERIRFETVDLTAGQNSIGSITRGVDGTATVPIQIGAIIQSDLSYHRVNPDYNRYAWNDANNTPLSISDTEIAEFLRTRWS